MSETICPDCGERNARGTEFCSACGAFLAWDGQEEAAPEPTPAVAPRPATAPPPAPQIPPAAANQPPAARPPAAAPPSGPPAGQPGQSWRPTQPVVAAGEQIVGQPAARAWNAAAPTFGTQLPGGFNAGSIAREAGLQPGGWPGSGWGGQGQGQPPHDPQGQPPQGPPAYQAPPEPPPPTEGPCPRCGVVNSVSLRFCSKCGLALRGPTLHDGGGARNEAPPERLPWWRKIFKPAPNTRRAARAAYRHSLPVRVRLIRWGLAFLGIGAIVGTLALIGQNPVGWAVNNWNDLVGKTTQVQNLDAYTEPQPGSGSASTTAGGPTPSSPNSSAPASSAAKPPVDTAQNVLDNLSDTAWTVIWSQGLNQQPSSVGCDSPPLAGASSILLVPSGSVTVKKISVAAGLPEGDSRRMLQWRPKTIQLSFSNGQCQQLVLEDVPGLQEKDLDAVDTSQVMLSIVDAYPPATDQPDDEISVTELRLFERG